MSNPVISIFNAIIIDGFYFGFEGLLMLTPYIRNNIFRHALNSKYSTAKANRPTGKLFTPD